MFALPCKAMTKAIGPGLYVIVFSIIDRGGRLLEVGWNPRRYSLLSRHKLGAFEGFVLDDSQSQADLTFVRAAGSMFDDHSITKDFKHYYQPRFVEC